MCSMALLCLLYLGSLWMSSVGQFSDRRAELPSRFTGARPSAGLPTSGEPQEEVLRAKTWKQLTQRHTTPGLYEWGYQPGMRIYLSPNESGRWLKELWHRLQGGGPLSQSRPGFQLSVHGARFSPAAAASQQVRGVSPGCRPMITIDHRLTNSTPCQRRADGGICAWPASLF